MILLVDVHHLLLQVHQILQNAYICCVWASSLVRFGYSLLSWWLIHWCCDRHTLLFCKNRLGVDSCILLVCSLAYLRGGLMGCLDGLLLLLFELLYLGLDDALASRLWSEVLSLTLVLSSVGLTGQCVSDLIRYLVLLLDYLDIPLGLYD